MTGLQLISNALLYKNPLGSLDVFYDKLIIIINSLSKNEPASAPLSELATYMLGVNAFGLVAVVFLIIAVVMSIVNAIKEKNWKKAGIIFGIMLVIVQVMFNCVIYREPFGGYDAIKTAELPSSGFEVLHILGIAMGFNLIALVGIVVMNISASLLSIVKKIKDKDFVGICIVSFLTLTEFQLIGNILIYKKLFGSLYVIYDALIKITDSLPKPGPSVELIFDFAYALGLNALGFIAVLFLIAAAVVNKAQDKRMLKEIMDKVS